MKKTLGISKNLLVIKARAVSKQKLAISACLSIITRPNHLNVRLIENYLAIN
jgi:hypothetical protein